jgi:hypothetical protein
MSPAICFSATAAQVQAALAALPSIGANNVVCTGGPLPGGSVTITFAGTLHAGPQPPITVVSNSLTGSSGPAEANAGYQNVYRNGSTELGVRPQLAVAGELDWGVQCACPATAVLSTALPDPADQPGIHEAVLQGTASGAVAAVATFSLREFSNPYQFRIVAANTAAAQPRMSKDQYDDLLNLLDTYHPVGVEGVTAGVRAFVHGFSRPLRWDRLPTAKTFARYRVD